MLQTMIAFALLMATAAYSQTPTPAPTRAAPEPSAYCRSGSAAIFQGAGETEISTVQQSCKRGDIIAVPAGSQGAVFAVGRLCDFSKAIVTTGGNIMCSLGPARSIR